MSSGLAIRMALWGAVGAFILAGPKWIICLRGREPGFHLMCALEFLIAEVAGAAGAVAFTSIVMVWFHLAEREAAASLVGLAINRVAPSLAEALTGMVNAAATGRSKGRGAGE